MGTLHDGALMLQLCSECLREVAVLRQELRDAVRSPAAPPEAACSAAAAEEAAAEGSCTAPAAAPSAPPPSPPWSEGAGERLRALCLVQDGPLRERLVSSLEGGSLATELGPLGGGAAARAGAELRAGRLRALVLDPSGAVRWDAGSALAAVEADGAGAAPPRLFLFPLFARPCRTLVEALVRICRRERVLPPLSLLLEALAALLARGASDREGVACSLRAELLAAVSGALAQPELRARLYAAPGGRVVVRDALHGAGAEDTPEAPQFPPYVDGDAPASLGGALCGDVERAAELVAPRLAAVQALCGTRAARRASGEAVQLGASAARGAEAQDVPSLFLGLLGALRCPGTAAALGLPEEAWRDTPGGALLWALEHLEFAEPVVGCWPGAATHPAAGGVDVLPVQADESDGAESQAESQGSAEDGREVSQRPVGAEEVQRARARFVQCFRDDFFKERPLLMSQVNNLYRMRNSGEALPYKRLGYESLHDFIMETPGLELHGERNKMEVRIGDPKLFDDFCDEIAEGIPVPECSRPQPMPATFLHRVVCVFQHVGEHGIDAQGFRNTWNLLFPMERLQCKQLGYRDLKGLLLNVPFVEKTGTKNNARFCLKPGFDAGSVWSAGGAPPSDRPASPWRVRAPAAAPFPSPPGSWAPAPPLQVLPGAVQLGADQPHGVTQPPRVLPGAMQLGADHPPGVTQVAGAWPGEASQQPAAHWPPGGLRMPDGFRRAPRPGDEASSSANAADRSQPPSRQVSEGSAWAEHHMRPQALPTPGGAFCRTPPRGLQLNLLQPPQHPGWVEAAGSAAGAQPHRRPPQMPPQSASRPAHGESRQTQYEAVSFASAGSLSEGRPTQYEAASFASAGSLSEGRPTQYEAAAAAETPRASPGAAAPAPNLAGVHASPALDARRGLRPPPRGPRLPGGRAVALPLQEPMQVSSAASSMYIGEDEPPPPLGVPERPRAQTGTPSPMEGSALDETVLSIPRRSAKQRGNAMFISTPGAISCPERDASTRQGRFDLGFVYQERLRTDRPCLIADLASGRVLFTNEACDRLFETLAPLPQRELNDLIFEEDRHQFSSSVLYLTIGSFSVMEPQEFRVAAAARARRATVTGEKLLDSKWWLAFDPCEDPYAAPAPRQPGPPGGLAL